MRLDDRELGYSCDIALERLLALYAASTEFERDCDNFNIRPKIIQCSQKQLRIGRRKDGIIPELIKYSNNYTRLTKEWRHDWKLLLNAISDDVKLEAERIAEKWGLKCDWGCGFILDSGIFLHPLKGTLIFTPSGGEEQTVEMNLSDPFVLSPGPPDSTAHLTTEISIYDTDDSIKQKTAALKRRAKTFREITQKRLRDLDYRGFEKHVKKEIATQVQWLFWHITPPYLNAVEIALRLQNTQGEYVDQFYIQRCYQNMAKLLGIKLVKGWTKGRKRASQQTRALPRESEIEAKIGLKNDL